MGGPSPPVPETKRAMGKEKDFNDKSKQREAKCKIVHPHEGAILSRVHPSPPFRSPAEAEGLELLPQVALELGQASLGLQFFKG